MAKTPTPKQTKLLKLIEENLLNLNETSSFKDLMLKAGYSLVSTHNPHITLESQAIVDGKKKIVEKFTLARDMALAELPKKIKKAPYNHLTDGVDKFQRNINLLTGQSTENKAIHIEISKEIAEKNMPTVITEVAKEVL